MNITLTRILSVPVICGVLMQALSIFIVFERDGDDLKSNLIINICCLVIVLGV